MSRRHSKFFHIKSVKEKSLLSSLAESTIHYNVPSLPLCQDSSVFADTVFEVCSYIMVSRLLPPVYGLETGGHREHHNIPVFNI